MKANHAVVIVSGGDAVSPFTTPTQACGRGLAAGNTDTYIRERLLAAGLAAYTAPAMNARSEVLDADPDSFGSFGDQPHVLPAHMTIISNGDIDNAGEHLARFLQYLHETEGITDISFVAHSNGGLFSTAATRILRETGSPLAIRSMAALGTPWTGSIALRAAIGEIDESALREDEAMLAFVRGMRAHLLDEGADLGLPRENTHGYLTGPHGWLAEQTGALESVPVLLVGGSYLTAEGGDPSLWPQDGIVSEYSGLAREVPESVMPLRRELSVPLVHSIFVADLLSQPWELAMTWNPGVLDAVVEHVGI